MGKAKRNKQLRIDNSHAPTMDDVVKVYETYKQQVYALLTTDNIGQVLTMDETTAEDIFGWTPDVINII